MEVTLNGRQYKLGKAHDLALPVQFGKGVAEFGSTHANKTPFAVDGFVGDVRAGGSCNCEMLTFSPHLHGTHTECIGHIVKETVRVHEILKDELLTAKLVRVSPQSAERCGESYKPDLRNDDRVITSAMLKEKIDGVKALVIHTGWQPGEKNPPYFTEQAMAYIVRCNIEHLLVDMPSIDRIDDDGKLTNHHLFWELPDGENQLAGRAPSAKTVTELLRVPQHLPDGAYVLNLQIAAFDSDAAPSRPILYEILK